MLSLLLTSPPVTPVVESGSTFLNIVITLVKCCINCCVILVPAYKSFKALESGKFNQCSRILVYCIVVTFFNAVRE